MLLIMYAFLLSATTLALDVMYFLGWLAPCQTCDPVSVLCEIRETDKDDLCLLF